MWGFFPLYIRVLRPAGAMEILAHRVVWSVAFVALLLTVVRRWRYIRELAQRPGKLAGIALAAALIAVNWGMYIFGVNSERVVETALGYFIGPLVMVLLGVVALRERLNLAQWSAVGIGTLAVAVLTIDYGRLPYIALTLATSFGAYSLVKKRLGVPAAEGLFIESAVLALPALAYLVWLTLTTGGTFGQGAGHTTLLVVAGAATAIPLLLFAGAANRIPMTGIGILQYIAPILQLGCGVLVFHEPMPPARLAGFALVWLALIIFTVDGLRTTRRRVAEREAEHALVA
ncbi:EamA family transporter RarD [Phytohabitans kaempferiae]|uniref:EamA family transporter RarD n=1 Tax=Phytohabitans kaempferiae TaxID=1620943 RepID=A0ABV6LWI5_9ACTN